MAVDWWAFGVLLYEMMAGFPPFYDEEVTNTYKNILNGRFSFPGQFSVSARDLIRKLLQVLHTCMLCQHNALPKDACCTTAMLRNLPFSLGVASSLAMDACSSVKLHNHTLQHGAG